MTRILAASILALGLAIPATAQAQGTLFIDLNAVGATSLQDEQTSTYTTTVFSETANATATYPKLGTAPGGVFGAAWVGSFPLGVGINVTRSSYEMTAGLTAHLPHPLFFNRYGDGVGESGTLERTETAVDLSAVFAPVSKGAWVVRLMAGPTRFTAKQDMIELVNTIQSVNVLGGNTVTIRPPDVSTVDGSAWGFHVGGDVGYFFSRHFGVGGTVRMNKATIDIEDPLTGEAGELAVGHVLFGGGLRLRF